ncbi:MAG: zinc-ribbon domain-containing protein [Terriglobales bacterium]
MVCPKCGEVNSDNFRFCGMCGTVLEARRPVGAPTPGLPMPVTPRAPAPTPANTLGPLRSPVPPSGGPSVLGLNQPILNQPMFNQPSMDSLRETAFSGLDSFFEPEQEKTGGRRLLLLLVLLAALGGAGWWTYTNYLGATQSRKPEAVTSSADEARAEKPAVSKPAISTATKPAAKDAAPAPDAGSSQAVAPATGAPQNQPESGRADHPDATRKTADAGAHQPVAAVKPTPASPTPAAIVRPEKSPAKIATAPVAADAGDADFRKGEAYLYGRGAPENCDEAVKYLKAASAKSNAKSRSAFGTMYATGHCVPRDLPTSYLWFAQALRVDPNNQILEKDLNAVWNQMTPPERQLATRMKQ